MSADAKIARIAMRQGFTKRRLTNAITVGAFVTVGFGLYHLVAREVPPVFIVAGSVGSFLGISLLAYIALAYSSRFT